MRHRLLIAVGLACLASGGCGDDARSEVSGIVRLNGEAIEEGSINFIPAEGNFGPGTGAVITNGKYRIPKSNGVMVGRNRVEIRAFRNSGRKVQDATGLPGTLTDERVPAFPPEFNDRSTLIRDVNRGSNTIDFDIQTGRGPP